MKYLLALAIPVALGSASYLAWDEGVRIEILQSAEKIPAALAPQRPVTLLFTGDLMLDRGVANHARRYGDASLFAGVKDAMQGADAVVVNLETTLTDFAPVAVPNGEDLRFTSDPRFAKLLADLNVKVATLSNNHTDDFGAEGLRQTRAHLDAATIAYYGSPFNAIADAFGKRVVNGKTICFAGYEGFIAADPTPIAEGLRAMRSSCDFSVATMHAGDEYVSEPTALQVRAARMFIDAGADLVIGSHPHIVQPLEIYQGKPIFYSLGNFIFDQDFSWNTTHGLLVQVRIGKDEASYQLLPIAVMRAEASVIKDAADEARLLSMLEHASWSADLRTGIFERKSFTAK